MREIGLQKSVLHGCACGLRDRKGNYMKKPWTIASTPDIVTTGLARKCVGMHAHVEARGKACKFAEDYTDGFARQ
eukprot:1117906-Pyramimonas_sp.AAC.1